MRSRESSRCADAPTRKRLSCEGGTIADHRQRENADSVVISAIALLNVGNGCHGYGAFDVDVRLANRLGVLTRPRRGLRDRRTQFKKKVHPRIWGDDDFSETGAVVSFHPAGITAISRGVSVRDTPGCESSKGDLHPEGMRASSPCQPDRTLLASLQDANHFVRTLPGVSRALNPRLIADIPSG